LVDLVITYKQISEHQLW